MVEKIMSFLCGGGGGGGHDGGGSCSGSVFVVVVVVKVHFLQSHSLVQGKCIDVSDEPTACILRVFQLAVCVYLIK
jgi:hypothetical protein